jgi:chromosome partitioning protein|tara:strand:- start:112 stop:771 length:660 start_codon:yes stop_codon:yes gene_type:complete
MLLIIKKETKVAKVVTFANVKGGSGKSTLCINMAAILIREGYSVALIDADQQKCSQDWITGTRDKLLSRIEIIDQAEFIASENVDVDFLLIDTQGSLTKEMAQFLFQSSLIITPCRVSRDDIVGQGWIEVFLKQSNRDIKKAPILTVLNGVNKRSSILSHVIEQLKEDGVQVAETCISQRVCFAETNVNKISVIGYNKPATEEIVDLTNEALNLIKSEA